MTSFSDIGCLYLEKLYIRKFLKYSIINEIILTSRKMASHSNSPNIQDDMEKILSQLKHHIDQRKKELENSFNTIFERLTKKKSELFQSLDSIMLNTEEEVRRKYLLPEEYKHKRTTALGSLEHVTFEKPDDFVASLNDIEYEKVDIPFVTIVKEPLELDFFVENYFQIKMITNPYIYKKHLKWYTNVTKGLASPQGICVCQFTGSIFVAESGRNCVQVFDKAGVHARVIKDLKMSAPHYLCINEKHLYVSCWENMAILKLENNTGIRIGYHHTKEHITGITVDKHEDLYGCKWKLNTIVVWDKDLVRKSEIKLDNLFISEDTQIRDICYLNKMFYILFTNSCFPIQKFNKKGDLIRCIVKDSDVKNSNHIAIDQYANTIFCDNNENGRSIKIFSNIGEQVHSIQIEHKEKGKAVANFDGIGFDPLEGNIYMCNSDNMYIY